MKTQLLIAFILMMILSTNCKREDQTIISAVNAREISPSTADSEWRDHTVYIGGRDNKFYALDARLQTPKWTFTTGGEIYASTSCVLDTIVYVGSTDNKVYALSKNSGKKMWEYNVGWMVYTSPCVKNGILYVAGTETNGGRLVALNAYTGSLLWKTDTLLQGDFYGSSSPTVVNGVLFTGTGTKNSVCALNANTGALIWKFSQGCSFYSSPCVAHGMVYVLGGNHTLYAINARNGKLNWSFQFAQGLSSLASTSPTVCGNSVYFIVDPQNYLYSLNASTGAVQWKFDPQRANGAYASPIAKNGAVFTVASNRIYALDSASGSVIWAKTIGENITASPTYASGVVYVTAIDDLMYALDATNGSIIGKYNFTGYGTTPVISSPVIENKNGRIFYPSISGMEQ